MAHAVSMPASPARDLSRWPTAARRRRGTGSRHPAVAELAWQRPLAITLPLLGSAVTLVALLAVAVLAA